MINLGEAMAIADARRQEFERSAEIYRRSRKARANTPPRSRGFTLWLGRQMVTVGEWLQTPAAQPS